MSCKFFLQKVVHFRAERLYTFVRILRQLPEGTMVAHKTGSSGPNEARVTAATNDIGIVTLPNGKHIAICVYVSNSKEDEATNEKIISDIAKIVWDCFLEKGISK